MTRYTVGGRALALEAREGRMRMRKLFSRSGLLGRSGAGWTIPRGLRRIGTEERPSSCSNLTSRIPSLSLDGPYAAIDLNYIIYADSDNSFANPQTDTILYLFFERAQPNVCLEYKHQQDLLGWLLLWLERPEPRAQRDVEAPSIPPRLVTAPPMLDGGRSPLLR